MTSQQRVAAGTENQSEGGLGTALVTVQRAISDLLPHPRNYRRHPEHQLAILRESLRVHGQQKPVVITPDGTVLAGHGLVEAARLEGWESIACHVYDGPYPDAFVVLDNRSSDLAEDDEDALAALLRDLEAQGQLSVAGWEQEDMRELLLRLEAGQRQDQEETFDAEAAMAEAEQREGPTRVQPGELWQLGRHRLFCGDCTAQENWERLMAGELAQAVITDPPYAVHYTGGRCVDPDKIAGHVPERVDAYWDEMSGDEYAELLGQFLILAHQYSDDRAPLYLWFASVNIRHVLASLDGAGWRERTLICWVKNIHAGNLFAQYKYKMEPCYYAHKAGQAPRWHGPTNEVNVWEHDKPSANDLHPTMKPLPLIERSIGNATELGQLVVDPFLGSGTAIIAAERTGRTCYGFELDAGYCDVIAARWEDFTGETAEKLHG